MRTDEPQSDYTTREKLTAQSSVSGLRETHRRQGQVGTCTRAVNSLHRLHTVARGSFHTTLIFVVDHYHQPDLTSPHLLGT